MVNNIKSSETQVRSHLVERVEFRPSRESSLTGTFKNLVTAILLLFLIGTNRILVNARGSNNPQNPSIHGNFNLRLCDVYPESTFQLQDGRNLSIQLPESFTERLQLVSFLVRNTGGIYQNYGDLASGIASDLINRYGERPEYNDVVLAARISYVYSILLKFLTGGDVELEELNRFFNLVLQINRDGYVIGLPNSNWHNHGQVMLEKLKDFLETGGFNISSELDNINLCDAYELVKSVNLKPRYVDKKLVVFVEIEVGLPNFSNGINVLPLTPGTIKFAVHLPSLPSNFVISPHPDSGNEYPSSEVYYVDGKTYSIIHTGSTPESEALLVVNEGDDPNNGFLIGSQTKIYYVSSQIKERLLNIFREIESQITENGDMVNENIQSLLKILEELIPFPNPDNLSLLANTGFYLGLPISLKLVVSSPDFNQPFSEPNTDLHQWLSTLEGLLRARLNASGPIVNAVGNHSYVSVDFYLRDVKYYDDHNLEQERLKIIRLLKQALTDEVFAVATFTVGKEGNIIFSGPGNIFFDKRIFGSSSEATVFLASLLAIYQQNFNTTDGFYEFLQKFIEIYQPRYYFGSIIAIDPNHISQCLDTNIDPRVAKSLLLSSFREEAERRKDKPKNPFFL